MKRERENEIKISCNNKNIQIKYPTNKSDSSFSRATE